MTQNRACYIYLEFGMREAIHNIENYNFSKRKKMFRISRHDNSAVSTSSRYRLNNKEVLASYLHANDKKNIII